MKVMDLLDLLKECDPKAEVKIIDYDCNPFNFDGEEIIGVASVSGTIDSMSFGNGLSTDTVYLRREEL